jgi:C-terminal processing protease CtpA/Prc
MKIRFILLITAFSFHCLAQNQAKFSAQAVKEDLKFLYETLDKSHYNLYVNTKKEIFDKEFESIMNSIEDSLTLIQINRLFQPFTALSKLGHCNIELPISSYSSYLQNGGTIFPLDLYFKDNQVFILENYSSDTSIVPGDEIISINGKPMKEVMNGIYKYLSGENDYSKNTQIEIISFPRLFWIVNGENKNYSVVIKKHDGKQINIDISSIPCIEFEGKMAQKKQPINPSRDFNFIDNIAYLRPGLFYNPPKDGNTQINSDVIDNKKFIRFLDSCFTVIHNKKTNELIIDLRGNPGGAATFSNPMVSFFATEPFIGGSKLLIRTSEINKNFWKESTDTSRFFSDIKKEVLSRENGSRFEIPLIKHKFQPRNDSLRFDSNVYILINRFSFSESIVISAMIQDYGFGKLIGEQTTPVAYGNSRQFKLPNTQMTVTFPAAYFIRVNGDTSLKGTIPDYIINDDVLTVKDEILDYTLDLIKKGEN